MVQPVTARQASDAIGSAVEFYRHSGMALGVGVSKVGRATGATLNAGVDWLSHSETDDMYEASRRGFPFCALSVHFSLDASL